MFEWKSLIAEVCSIGEGPDVWVILVQLSRRLKDSTREDMRVCVYYNPKVEGA